MSENQSDQSLEELKEQTQKGNRLDSEAPRSFKEDVAGALERIAESDDQPMLSVYDENLRAFIDAVEANEQREEEFRAAVADAAGRSDETGKRSPMLANLLRVGIREVDEELFESAREAASEQIEF